MKHSISVKCTGVGIAFLAILLVTVIVAISENNSIALLLASILLAVFIVTIVKGAMNVPPLRLAKLEFDDTFAGESVQVRGTVTSRFRVPDASLKLVVESTTELGDCTILRREASFDFAMKLPPHKRGRLQLEALVIRSSFPLGMLDWSIRFDGLQVAGLIYPAPIDYLVDREQVGGKGQSAAIGDFDELQTWQNGDSLSGVCWKTYAKTGRRMRKRFLDSEDDSWAASKLESEEDSILDGDALPSLADEERRSQLCYWIVERQRRRIPYGLRFRGQVVKTGADSRHYERCLEILTEG